MIVAGFGFRQSATLASLQDAWQKAGAAEALATLSDKADHPAFVALAKANALPVIAVTSQKSLKERTATHSDTSMKHRNTGSVSEAVALAAAGPGARLLAPRVISTDRLATCALAQSAPIGSSS